MSKKTIPEEITEYQLELIKKFEDRIKARYKIKSSCGKCYGTGINGFFNKTPLPCTCLRKKDPTVIKIGDKEYTQEQWNKKTEEDNKKVSND